MCPRRQVSAQNAECKAVIHSNQRDFTRPFSLLSADLALPTFAAPAPQMNLPKKQALRMLAFSAEQGRLGLSRIFSAVVAEFKNLFCGVLAAILSRMGNGQLQERSFARKVVQGDQRGWSHWHASCISFKSSGDRRWASECVCSIVDPKPVQNGTAIESKLAGGGRGPSADFGNVAVPFFVYAVAFAALSLSHSRLEPALFNWSLAVSNGEPEIILQFAERLFMIRVSIPKGIRV